MGGEKRTGDRIWQMYDGEFGEIGRRQARERIHWICRQVRGRDVLDVGCSQGICDVLLGREGFHVVGIDLDANAITYAGERLSQESPGTQEKVTFLLKDFMSFSADEQQYDTIILTEILEHLLHPQEVLQKATSLLKADGRIVVSVPFGINDWPDHKRTYYLSGLLEQIEAVADVGEVKFFSQWMACIAHPKDENISGITVDMSLIAQEEAAFYQLERTLRDQLRSSMKEVAEQKQQFKMNEGQLRGELETQKKLLSEKNVALLQQERVAQEQADTITEQTRLLSEKDAALIQQERVMQEQAETLAEQTKLLSEKDMVLLQQERAAQEQTKTIADQTKQLTQIKAAGEKSNQIAYRKQKKLEWQLSALDKKYQVLSGSKLGRIQLRIWHWRASRKRDPFWTRLKVFAKRFPLLVSLGRLLRGKKFASQSLINMQTNSDNSGGLVVGPDMGYYDRIRSMVEQLPESNGSRYYHKLKPRIGWITDQILYDAYRSVADGILLTPDNWEESLEKIDWLFIISGWHGMKQEWAGFARPGSPKRELIYQIINACKQCRIPTAFYSVEDPPNYDRFIGIAQRCDQVFTAAVEMLPRYREDCGHERVHQLCYGIDPILHNPIGFRKFPKQPEVFFAGSWMNKYPERGKDMEQLFCGVLKSGKKLKIVDRNMLLNKDEYRFPSKYSSYLAPPLEHGTLQRVHKLYDWAININSVKESATMFANRTYELQAMGILMVSNYSVGVNSLLPAIFTCQHSEEIPNILNCLTPEEVYEHQVMGVRMAMRGNTCFERVAEILGHMGIQAKLPQYTVAVVMPVSDLALQNAFAHQTYPYREAVMPEQLQTRYQEFDLVAFFHPSFTYGDFYLEDMINGFKYTDSDYITKAGYYQGQEYVEGPEHDYVSIMADKYKTVFWASAFQPEQLLAWQESITLERGYSIDHFMFNAGTPVPPSEPDSYDISVIVPIYNNGSHLYGKAFNSLRRSSLFFKMEILLIDDGSTDPFTTSIVRTLATLYPNVKTFFFGDGGSGSASRPRNKGVEMASAEYITFLDPDNEAVNDAYFKMLEISKTQECDIVVGNMARFRLKEELADYNYYFRKYCGMEEITGDKKRFLSQIFFTPMSIQAMVIRKEIIIRSGISQVVGAVGQDSFFSWQLFLSAARIKSVPLVAHIYYAMVQNSTVNSVGGKYFQRSLLQEEVQREWLVENSLMDAYMSARFNVFFRDWYLKKLLQAKEGEEETCAQLLWQIFQLYGRWYDGEDETINRFILRMQNHA